MNYASLLLDWFDEYRRDMPWRRTKDPYCIWVSETMLQQTQVDTVIPYYNRFIERFPEVSVLANAEIEEVYQYWQGLGYYRRAANLHKGAKLIQDIFEGEFPKNPMDAKKIPGVGPYTLGAVLSIAFGMPLPAVDGNVMRVLSRQFMISDDIAVQKNRKIFEEKVMELMPDDPNRFNQALMELGALICTPKNPKCSQCSMSSVCKAYEAECVGVYPVKTPKAKPLEEHYDILLIKKNDSVWMEKREDDGLLAGLWGLPMIGEKQTEIYDNILAETSSALPLVKHTFTHKRWHMTPKVIVYKDEIKDEIELFQKGCIDGQYVTKEEMKQLPIATAFKKVIEKGMWL